MQQSSTILLEFSNVVKGLALGVLRPDLPVDLLHSMCIGLGVEESAGSPGAPHLGSHALQAENIQSQSS